MKHVFKSECPNADELLDNCMTLDQYISNIHKQSSTVKTSHYFAHGLEALVEMIILCEKGSLRLKNYEPRPSCDNDLFVHGIAEKSNGGKAAIMICTVNDGEIPLTSNGNHLTTFFSNAVEKFGVEVDEPKGLRVFSNSKTLHENTREQFCNDKGVMFYLKEDIERMVNGNTKFWKLFKKEMKNCGGIHIPEIQLRDFQQEASQKIKEMKENSKGQVILPTGSGKSLIAIHSIYNEICSSTTPSPCVMIMTPRIVLTYQLLAETINYLKSKRMDAQYLNLNSGVFDDDKIKNSMAESGLPIRDIPSTTTKREIEYYYNKAVRDGVPFIISATYQSAARINGTIIPEICMAIHDEAHNLVMGRFSSEDKENVFKIKAKKKIFFTATQALSKDKEEESYKGNGMDNTDKYGEVIYHIPPKDMIARGEIIPPFIHIVNVTECKIGGKQFDFSSGNLANEDIERNTELMAKVVEISFDEHLNQIKKHSCNPCNIGGKVVIVCSNDQSFRSFLYSQNFIDFKNRRPDVKFFGISSNFGAWINGEHIEPSGGMWKEKFMLALRGLKPEENAIVFHIDMLGEGIDIPGITGVLSFRELGTIKSCQTIGRAMRLVKQDRESLYNHTRLASEKNKMIKPYAWVIIPVYSSNHHDIKQRLSDTVKMIREYNDNPSELFMVKTPPSKQEMPLLPDLPKQYPSSDILKVNHAIENVMMEMTMAEDIEKKKQDIQKELDDLMNVPSAVEQIIKQPEVKPEINREEIYILKWDGVTARGKEDGKSFVVLAGSSVRVKVNDSMPECYLHMREELIRNNKIDSRTWTTTEDIGFKTKSAAAVILMGASINGRVAWKKYLTIT